VTRFLQNLLSRLHFRVIDNRFRVFELGESDEKDITLDLKTGALERAEMVARLMSYSSFRRKASAMVKQYVDSRPGWLIFVTNNRPDKRGPLIVAEEKLTTSSFLHQNADRVVGRGQNPARAILEESIIFNRLKTRQEQLARAVDNGLLPVESAFRRENWPVHPLMERVKAEVKQAVDAYLAQSGMLCDPLDAEYQVIFRLTTFELNQLFINGGELVDYCDQLGVFSDWRQIPAIDPEVCAKYHLNPELLAATVEEQMSIIRQRLARSPLPIRKLLEKTQIFAESGWEIKKEGRDIFLIKKNNLGRVVDQQEVEFKMVEPAVAVQIHKDFHYIHTPRCEMAMGFFLPGDPLPFSVLAIEPVDRPYKQNALLLYGYDPRYCLDFTRLWSRPGVPRNISSAIFGEAFRYLRQTNPRLQATITAFMASYATGLSMLTGGFETPILIKPGRHYFTETTIDGRVCLEHITKRRQTNQTKITQVSRFPLLPVIELISPLQAPRFKPILVLGREMVSIS